jgi:hypothetical protein
MEQSLSWEASRSLASQEIPRVLWNSEGSLPHSQEPATCSPGPRLCIAFRTMVIFYGEELLAARPTPKLEGHPLSAVVTAFSMYSQLPSISGGRSSILHPCRGDRDPLIMRRKQTFK